MIAMVSVSITSHDVIDTAAADDDDSDAVC